MLVLSRRVGETILIGNDILVRVSAVSGSRVQLAIEAPQRVPIRRKELSEHYRSLDFAEPMTQNAPK